MQGYFQHKKKFEFVAEGVGQLKDVMQKLVDFQVAIPSWALGSGGTRFGRFAGGGEPRNLEEKIEDVGLLHALNQSSGAISLHIPWDKPKDIGDLLAHYHTLCQRQEEQNKHKAAEIYTLARTLKAGGPRATRLTTETMVPMDFAFLPRLSSESPMRCRS